MAWPHAQFQTVQGSPPALTSFDLAVLGSKKRRRANRLISLQTQLFEEPQQSNDPEATMANALSDKERALIDAYWRAANYLSIGQIYLYDNPLLKQSLTKEHIKPRLLGHWGTTP